jgi:uncharacterized protein YkwD
MFSRKGEGGPTDFRPKNTMTRSWACLMICGGFALLGAGEPGKPFQQTPDEIKLVEMTNQERKKMDLPSLKLSSALSKIARGHSENMARQGKMEHILDNKALVDRLRDAGYKFAKGGENIASGGGVSLATIMQAWMDSKGHRANILSTEFTEIGLGIARDKTGQLYFTQVFAKPRK